MSAQLADLNHFTGSETFYKNSLYPAFVYTEGARYVLQTAEAYWLLDAIFSVQIQYFIKKEAFQHWKLIVTGHRGKLTCDDGNKKIIYEQIILRTDFPVCGITFFFTDNVLMLPNEY